MPAHRFGATQTLARCDKVLPHLALFAIFVIVSTTAITFIPIARAVVVRVIASTVANP